MPTIITVKPNAKWPGKFDAFVGELQIVCASLTPFLTGARKLLALGFNPQGAIIMRHHDSEVDCLLAKIAVAAKLTVDEGERTASFHTWKPHPRSIQAPSTAPNEAAATHALLSSTT
jgi:hypothetical protein